MNFRDRRWLVGVLVLTLMAAIYWWLPRGYGKTSKAGYEYATALFSACNQQDHKRLQTISAMLAAAETAGEISPHESKWLKGIVAKGLADEWAVAARDVRRLMKDQAVRSSAP